jgi:hypothetical protein
MKKISIIALLMVFGISFCQAQSIADYSQTSTGLYYKFHVKTDSKKAQIGNILIAEIWVYQDGKQVFTNAGIPEPMFMVMESQHNGDLMEGLQMIGVGDSISFAFNMDTLRKYNPGMLQDENIFLFYTIKVHGIYTEAEFEIKIEKDRIRGEAEEAEKLAAYISAKKIITKPNVDGVYVILEKTTIPKRRTVRFNRRGQELPISDTIAKWKTVRMISTASLLDGTIIFTVCENVAKKLGIHDPQHTYVPFEFEVGAGRMIQGMENAVVGMQIGTKARLIIPSNMAYGEGRYLFTGDREIPIPAYSTLIYDIEIVEVK